MMNQQTVSNFQKYLCFTTVNKKRQHKIISLVLLEKCTVHKKCYDAHQRAQLKKFFFLTNVHRSHSKYRIMWEHNSIGKEQALGV